MQRPATFLPTTGRSCWLATARILVAVFLVIILAVLARLANWQLWGNAAAPRDNAAAGNDLSRGRIVDRNALLLATDSFVWEAYANPTDLRKADHAAAIAISLTQVLQLPLGSIQASLASTGTLVTLEKNADEAKCQALTALAKQADIPWLLWCDARRHRVYPQGSLGAHLIGFANLDQRGVYGAEGAYDDWLRPAVAWPDERLPGQPQPLPEIAKLYLPSPTGRDLILHMDAALQHMVEKRLAEALTRYEAITGTIVIVDPRSGGILALANLPSFDPNNYGAADQSALVNAAAVHMYEPGSVFKLIPFAAALDLGQITADTVFNDDGTYVIGGRAIRNADRGAHGEVTARQALAQSLNVVSAQIGMDMGPNNFYRYVHQFGFGKPTEVDLTPESHGLLKEPGNPLWAPFDQAVNSFGQAVSITSLQMVNAVATIANGGVRLQPQVVKALVKNGQVYPVPPRTLGYAVKPQTAAALAEMMTYTVDKSQYSNMVPGYRIAGKTGTAEVVTETGYSNKDVIVSFVGFLPAADPQLVILVKLAQPKRATWAEHSAMPVFGQVAQDAVRILRIQPNDRTP